MHRDHRRHGHLRERCDLLQIRPVIDHGDLDFPTFRQVIRHGRRADPLADLDPVRVLEMHRHGVE